MCIPDTPNTYTSEGDFLGGSSGHRKEAVRQECEIPGPDSDTAIGRQGGRLGRAGPALRAPGFPL